MALSDLETLADALDAALADGDYDTAISKAIALKSRLAITPNVARNLAGGGSQSLAWLNAVALDGVIKQCRAEKARVAAETYGIQRTKITYARPDSE